MHLYEDYSDTVFLKDTVQSYLSNIHKNSEMQILEKLATLLVPSESTLIKSADDSRDGCGFDGGLDFGYGHGIDVGADETLVSLDQLLRQPQCSDAKNCRESKGSNYRSARNTMRGGEK